MHNALNIFNIYRVEMDFSLALYLIYFHRELELNLCNLIVDTFIVKYSSSSSAKYLDKL